MLIWWRTWHDDERRLWADRQMTGDPADGKKQHAADKQFRWIEDGMHAPAISPLEFVTEGRGQYIAAGFVRETDTDRHYNIGGTPPPATDNQPQTPPTPPRSRHDELPF